MKVSEPAIAYAPSPVQGLKNRLLMSIDETDDMEKLQQCLELLHEDSMPGIYTEVETSWIASPAMKQSRLYIFPRLKRSLW